MSVIAYHSSLSRYPAKHETVLTERAEDVLNLTGVTEQEDRIYAGYRYK
jgi:hypothetical protein